MNKKLIYILITQNNKKMNNWYNDLIIEKIHINQKILHNY